jgi:sugar lactone lactonase YvrE
MGFPNGSVISPDGSLLIVAETMPFRLTAFDIASDGTLTNRRIFAQLEFVPADGICLDAEGQVWVANPLASEVIRVTTGGEVTARASTSCNTFACMLGGDDRRTLFVMTSPTSDRFTLDGAELARIESVRVEVPGAGLP